MANKYLEKIAEVLKEGSSPLLRMAVGARRLGRNVMSSNVGKAVVSEGQKLSPGNLRLDKEYLGTGGMVKNIAKNRIVQVGAGVAAGAMIANKNRDQ